MIEYAALLVGVLALLVAITALVLTKKKESFSSAGNVMDMQEFATVHPQLKRMYKETVVEEFAPAVMELINGSWKTLDEGDRQAVMKEARAAARKAAQAIRKNALERKDLAKAMKSLSIGDAVGAAVAATAKPTART